MIVGIIFGVIFLVVGCIICCCCCAACKSAANRNVHHVDVHVNDDYEKPKDDQVTAVYY